MDLDLTPEQELLRDTVRGVCTKHAGLDVVRQMEDDPIGYPEKFWLQLAELGLLGLTLPEAWGGSGMSMLDAVVVYQELGRALAPSPHFVSSVISGGVIARTGTDDQRTARLPAIAAGDAIVTPAWLEPGRGFGPEGVQLRARPDGDGWRLTGTKRHVPFARAAERLLVLARADEGVALLLVDPGAEGVALDQQRTISSDTQYRVDFDGVRVASDAIVGKTDGGWATWDAVMHDGIILLAAQAVGGARQALDITVQYAKDRRQFDKPLGAFQAIAHYLADAVTAVDGAETLVWEAAWARDAGRSTARLAPMAKLFACRTFRDVTAMAQQVFGGVGFTVEYDIQLYFRRAKQLQLSWWDDRYLEELIATDVLDTARAPDDAGLLDRSIATLLGYFELGNEVVVTPHARFVRNLESHRIYDANHGTAVRAETAIEIDDVLRRADDIFSDVDHRTFKVDPRTASAFEGCLLHEGYTGSSELQLLLDDELDARPPTIDIRTVSSDADWDAVARLTRLDHEEEAQKASREPVDPVVTAQMVATKRVKAPDLAFFLATVDGVDCAFFSSWPGANGVGKVEDLFTIPAFRRRGIATALIAHAVRDARLRGAGPVLIGADPDDTPKHMYAAMGFRPFCVLRSYTR